MISERSHIIVAPTLLSAAHLWLAGYDTALMAKVLRVSEETIFNRLEDIRRVAEKLP